jgi:hypothetical protein
MDPCVKREAKGTAARADRKGRARAGPLYLFSSLDCKSTSRLWLALECGSEVECSCKDDLGSKQRLQYRWGRHPKTRTGAASTWGHG